MYIFEIILKTFCKSTSKFLIVGTLEEELQWLCLMFNTMRERERERERERGERVKFHY